MAGVRHWLQMLLASFLMYEVFWSVIEMQFEPLAFDLEEMLLDFGQCALFTLVIFVVNRFFVKFRNGRYARSLVEVVCLLAANALIIVLIDNVLFTWDSDDDDFWSLIDIYVICIICSLLSIINIQYAYHKQFVAMKREQARLRLSLLQQQLSPHFMFNSLSTLQGMIAADPQKAEEYLAALSHIFRYIADNIGKEKVPVADALNFIKDYMKMLDGRSPGHFVFNIDESNKPGGAYVVPVSLQIVVENAIKHNSHSLKRPLEISVSFGDSAIEVSNKIQRVAFTDSLGIGLKNLDERYKIFIGKGLGVSETKEHYTVKIPYIS